ncbi:MAG: hypothetical protein PHG25_01135 [Candidatus Pacebacteria bacterium]|nr:hypothetical protein [Candidatus Paceibacterota bacterium]
MTPTMTPISALGSFCIAIFVQHWNDSSDHEKKEFVRASLQSKDETENENGLTVLYHIVNERLHDQKQILGFEDEKLCITNEIQWDASKLQPGPIISFSRGVAENELIERALAEVVLYFKSRFTCKELDHILVPNLYYATEPLIAQPASYEFCETGTRGDGSPRVEIVVQNAAVIAKRLPHSLVVEPPNEVENSAPKN